MVSGLWTIFKNLHKTNLMRFILILWLILISQHLCFWSRYMNTSCPFIQLLAKCQTSLEMSSVGELGRGEPVSRGEAVDRSDLTLRRNPGASTAAPKAFILTDKSKDYSFIQFKRKYLTNTLSNKTRSPDSQPALLWPCSAPS